MANIKQTGAKSKSKAGSPKKRGSGTPEFDRARKSLDKKKEKRALATQWAHFWDVCPKCGGDMFEQISLGIRYEVCRSCHGIYVDQAEAGLVKRFLDPSKWLRAVLTRSKKPRTP